MPDALGIGERPELPLGCDVGDRLSSGVCLKQGSNLSADSLAWDVRFAAQSTRLRFRIWVERIA